jgi:hypothetical protein
VSESDIQKAILDYLAARHVLAFRMQTGQAKMGDRYVRFGTQGMADILAFKHRKTGFLASPAIEGDYTKDVIVPLWIEMKTDKGKQSPFQKSFQEQVEDEGHMYIVARSIEDVEEALR